MKEISLSGEPESIEGQEAGALAGESTADARPDAEVDWADLAARASIEGRGSPARANVSRGAA